MLHFSSALFFFVSLIMGTIMTFSSTSWFMMWMGLELNMLSFLPLILTKLNMFFSESAVKYFLVQAMGSTIFVVSSMCLTVWSDFAELTIILSMLLKLGAAPFYFWFPQVMAGLAWNQVLILMTLQKVAPMMILTNLTFKKSMISIIIFAALLSALAGALGALNITSLKKIMAFSSINHMSWMLLAMLFSESSWTMYFAFYSIISISVVLFFSYSQCSKLSDLVKPISGNSLMMFNLAFNLFSLMGLPPFIGFLPKLSVAQLMMSSSMILPLIVLLGCSLITGYYYIRIIMYLMLVSSPIMSFKYKFNLSSMNKIMPYFTMFNSISFFFVLTLIFL